MAYAAIPGMTFPMREDIYVEVMQFDGTWKTTRVPGEQKYGKCRNIDDFRTIGQRPAGNFGTIYKVKERNSGKLFALKKLHFPKSEKKNGAPRCMLMEISLRKLLNHEHIVNFHGVVVGYDLIEDNYLLLDYCIINLQDLITYSDCSDDAIFEQSVIKYIMRQLCEGIDYIHECKMAHRNISTANLLFTEVGLLKIGGFRTITWDKEDNMSKTITDLRFRAPELLLKTKYDHNVDIWSVGCVFAHLLLKTHIFDGNSEKEILYSIFDVLGTPSERIWPGFDNDILKKGTRDEKEIKDPMPYSDLSNVVADVPHLAANLLRDLLIYYPKARLPAKGILRSPYFTNNLFRACSMARIRGIIEDVLLSPITIE